jgi:excisionase family DNA binding protein
MKSMSALEEDYLTVVEAAALLRVAPSTIRRWIREGDLPAYRLGRRRVGLRRHDLSRLVKPVRAGEARNHDAYGDLEHIKRRKLTPEEVERGLAAMDRAELHAQELLAARGGELFPDSAEVIHRMRQERTRQLTEALGWDDLY